MRISAGLTAALIAGTGLAVTGQDSTFRVTSNLVSVYATVTLADGRYARDLTAADFRLSDNGEAREISVFSNDVQPITVSLIVDESGSMLPRLVQIRAAAQAFVAAMLAGDRAAFGTLTHDGVALTADKVRLAAGIRAAADWQWWDTGSPIWSALDRSMSALANEPGRRVLVILTDGLDMPSTYPTRPRDPSQPVVRTSGSDVARRAIKDGFILYAIGFRGSPFDAGLQTIARQSGGAFELLAGDEDMTRAFTRVVDDLHQQYLLGFVPTSTDGAAHTIEVRCLRPGTTVRAREHYIAETPPSTGPR